MSTLAPVAPLDFPSAPVRIDDVPRPTKPARRLWRTLLNRPRPARRFAPRLTFDPTLAGLDPAVAAHWGELLLIEDVASILHRDGTVTWLRHIVAWLYGAENLADWDEIVRTYDSRKEVHRVLTAQLYPVEGKPRMIKPTVQQFAYAGARGSRAGRSLQFNFHPLRPGVVVEFEEQYDEFVADRAGPLLVNQFFLQTRAPCLRRRYTAAVAAPYELHYRVHHSDVQPALRRDKEYSIAAWELSDAEGTEYDNWNPPPRDFLPWIDVSTAAEWGRFARQLRQELVRPAGSKTTAETERLAQELTADKPTPLAQARSAYAYAARSVRYGRPPAEHQARNTRAASQVFEDLRGDCKDKSSLLVQLLRQMGMQAEIAVLLTADEGRTPFLPSARFNHAIVRATVEGVVHWLDPASGLFTFGQLPEGDTGVAAMILDGETFAFDRVAFPDKERFDTIRRWQGRIDEQGDFVGQLHAEYNGESAARLRQALIDRTAEHCERALRSWLGNEHPGFEADQLCYTAPDDLDGPLSVSCQMRAERIARRVQDAILVQPPWYGAIDMNGPFASPTRRQPLVVPAFYQTDEQFTIELPPGTEPLAAPEPAAHACDWARYDCLLKAEGNTIRCRRRLRLAGRGAHVPAERFNEFRRFWQLAYWSDTNPIVMKRVSAT
ncbi:MAG: DUF3857 domain-containing protein [Pirellulales bacterium]|nr:DUF3857 domain-containing protein [Pirellulales bacterium]